jgi:hypothetical protein
VRDPGGELDVLEAAGDFAEGVGQHLAVLGGDERGDLLAVGVDELAHVEHDLGPPTETRRPPPDCGCLGGGNGGVDLGDAGEVDARRLLPRCRVEHPARTP